MKVVEGGRMIKGVDDAATKCVTEWRVPTLRRSVWRNGEYRRCDEVCDGLASTAAVWTPM
jgi:hypothetical protein